MKWKEFARDRYQRCEIIPWWKGYVTSNLIRDDYIVAPLGFNIIFYIMLSFWWWISTAPIGFDRFRQDRKRRK